MSKKIKFRRGTLANLPDLDEGEPGWVTDSKALYVGDSTASGVFVGGAVMSVGAGAPDNADGSDGDFYFRTGGTVAGDTLIYHKEAGAWVALVIS